MSAAAGRAAAAHAWQAAKRPSHAASRWTNSRSAERLFLSSKTVGIHVSRILDKLGVHTRVEP